MHCDTSAIDVGVVLAHNSRPIAYESRILYAAELNYSINERECSAMIWTLNKFRYFYGITGEICCRSFGVDKSI